MNDSKVDDLARPSHQVVQITTGARLHFGLLSTTAPFGGVGVMIDRPVTAILIKPAESFQCTDQASERIVDIARRVGRIQGSDLPNCSIQVIRRAEAHCGLGSGTQLAMAVAEGLAVYRELSLAPEDLAARIAQRGRRSAVGVHGYLKGGLIYEGGDDARDLNTIQRRIEIPDDWCIAIFRPLLSPLRVSGPLEQSHFDSLTSTPTAKQQRLAAIVQKQMIPAAERVDFARFVDAVQRYNYESGLLFKSVQGGPYNRPAVNELVDLSVSRGAVGVGQSSWGPTVFAWFEDADRAVAFQQSLPATVVSLGIAKPLNRPRTLRSERCD